MWAKRDSFHVVKAQSSANGVGVFLCFFASVEDIAGDFAAVGAADVDDIGEILETEEVFQDTLNEGFFHIDWV